MSSIAVLIPHYNDIPGLEKTLRSISSIEPVDVVIVDDGSVIKPNKKDLENKFKNISNIHVLYNEKNMGIEYALNKGLKFIYEKGYKYTARLDCNDISYEERFLKQKEFLDNNPDVYIVGSWVEFVDKNGKLLFTFTPPSDYEQIKKKMFINNMMIHPSVMFRTEAVDIIGYYPTDKKNAEDYAYFFKFVKNFKVANINQVLTKCEIDPKGLSLSKRRLQIKNRIKIIWDNFDFSIYAFYGLVRNSIMLFVPYPIVEKIKKLKGKV